MLDFEDEEAPKSVLVSNDSILCLSPRNEARMERWKQVVLCWPMVYAGATFELAGIKTVRERCSYSSQDAANHSRYGRAKNRWHVSYTLKTNHCCAFKLFN